MSLYFVTGIGLASTAVWLAALFDLSFRGFVAAWQWALALYLAAAAARDWRLRAKGIAIKNEYGGPSRDRGSEKAYLTAAVIIAVVTAFYQPVVDFHQDAFDHIGYIRHIESENSLTPAGVLAPPVDDPQAAGSADPRKGTFHVIMAAAAHLASVEPDDVPGYMAVFLFPLAFLSFTAFCRPFLPRRWMVAVCSVLFLLFQGGIGFEYAGSAAYGHNLSLLFYWVMVPLCFAYLRTKKKQTLICLLLVFTGGAFMHAGVIMHFAILLATIAVFSRMLALEGGSPWKLCLWGFLAVAATATWKITASYGPGNVIHVHPQGLLYFGDDHFVMSPVEIIRQHGLLFLGGMVLGPLLLFFSRRGQHARRIIAFAVFPALICFTPFVTPLIYERLTYMAFRSVTNVPVYALTVLVVYELVKWSRRGNVFGKLAAVVILAAWSWVFLSPGLGAFFRAVAHAKNDRGAQSISGQYADLRGFLSEIPPGSVVLSDPKTSYWISAATGLRVVAVLGQHGNPNDVYAMDRLEAARDVISPYTLQSQAAAACDRYGVDYVVLNGRMRQNQYEYLVDWNPDFFERTRARLASAETKFRPVFQKDEVVVFKYYANARGGGGLWSPQNPSLRLDGIGLTPCVVKAPGRTFEVRHVGLAPDRVLPGETVYLTIGYDKRDVSGYQLPVMIYVRFDHESVSTGSSGIPGEKFVRRYRDRRGGYASRFRYNHHPFGGYYTPDLWPIGKPFHEVVEIELPPTLKKGKYSVQLKIVTEPLLPNFSVRDFLFNRDQYSGVPCLTVEVTDYAVR